MSSSKEIVESSKCVAIESPNNPSEMPTIPDAIISSEIMPNLPTKTLLRFKCLNKLYYNLISSQKFIHLHLTQSSVSSNPNRSLIVFSAQKCYQQCLYMFDFDSPNSPARYLKLPEPFSDKTMPLKVVGTCHGLTCLYCEVRKSLRVYENHCMILNPSTGEVIAEFSLPVTELSMATYSGFGYDDSNDDYKAVVIQYYILQMFSKTERRMYRKVTVYSVKSNSLRCIENAGFNELDLPLQASECVLIRNHLMHWLLAAPGRESTVICFDLENEKWATDVALPDSVASERRNCSVVIGELTDDLRLVLGVVDGCLCLTVDDAAGNKFDVWIMKEYRVQGSWTRISLSVAGPRIYTPILGCEYAAIEDILVAKTKHDITGYHTYTYVWYNLRDKTAREIQFSGAPRALFLKPHLCLGSLATRPEDFQDQNRKAKYLRVEIDDKVKIRHANK